MSRVRPLLIVSLCLLVGGCTSPTSGSSPTATSATSGSPTASSSFTGIPVQAIVDLKGQEAYGLAVDATAVWAIAYQTSTLSRIDPATNTVASTLTLANAASVIAVDNAVWVVSY